MTSVARQSEKAPGGIEKSTAFTPDDFTDIYPPGIERHYWNHARNRIIFDLVKPLARPGCLLLDVGCGTGIVTAYLRGRGLDCHGCDLGIAKPIDAETGRVLTYGVDACELPEAFRSTIGLITMLDVLEHIEKPNETLGRLRDAFRNLEHVFFTVPARMDIWSNYDERNRHYRRYDASTVGDLAEQGRFELIDWSYFFHALYFPARLMKILGIDRQTELKPPAALRPAHDLLAGGFVIEQKTLPKRMPGSSIYGVLRIVR